MHVISFLFWLLDGMNEWCDRERVHSEEKKQEIYVTLRAKLSVPHGRVLTREQTGIIPSYYSHEGINGSG